MANLMKGEDEREKYMKVTEAHNAPFSSWEGSHPQNRNTHGSCLNKTVERIKKNKSAHLDTCTSSTKEKLTRAEQTSAQCHPLKQNPPSSNIAIPPQ